MKRQLPSPSRRYRALVFGFWTVMSLAVLVLWLVEFASGRTWGQGLFAYQNGNIPIFHVVAEASMAITVLIGLSGWRRQTRDGACTTIFGVGMFCYSAINSLGWALHNSRAMALPMCASLIGAALLAPVAIADLGRDPRAVD